MTWQPCDATLTSTARSISPSGARHCDRVGQETPCCPICRERSSQLDVRGDRDQHLVQDHLGEHLVPGILRPFGEASGIPAVAPYQIGQTGAAEGPQGRPDLHPPWLS